MAMWHEYVKNLSLPGCYAVVIGNKLQKFPKDRRGFICNNKKSELPDPEDTRVLRNICNYLPVQIA